MAGASEGNTRSLRDARPSVESHSSVPYRSQLIYCKVCHKTTFSCRLLAEIVDSIPQYKRKLKDWDYTKNLKASICRSIGGSLKRRGLTYNTAKTVVGGVALNPERLKRALQRHNVPSLKRKWNSGRYCLNIWKAGWSLSETEQRSPTPEEVQILNTAHVASHVMKTTQDRTIEDENHSIQLPRGVTAYSGQIPSGVDSGTLSSNQPKSVAAPMLPPQWPINPCHTNASLSSLLHIVRTGRVPGENRRPLDNIASIFLLATALDHAVASRDAPVVKRLLDYSATSPELPSHQESISLVAPNPLFHALVSGDQEISEILLRAGVGVEQLYRRYYHLPSGASSTDGTIAQFFDRAAEPCCLATILYLVIYNRHTRLLRKLLDWSKYDKRQMWHKIPCALALPVWLGYAEGVEILIKGHANVRAVFATGSRIFNLLQAAAFQGHSHVIPILIKAGIDINSPALGRRGRTALQHAARNGDKEMSLSLLEHGADVNAPCAEDQGLTALQAAAMSGKEDIVELLLRRGAEVNAPASKKGYTSLSASIRADSFEVFELLVRAGARFGPGQYDLLSSVPQGWRQSKSYAWLYEKTLELIHNDRCLAPYLSQSSRLE